MSSSTIIVNLFAGPGAGKSTMAAGVFAELKWNGVNAELVTEFAKELVWEGRFDALSNQSYVFGEQLQRVSRLIGNVDVIVTDSPILLSIIYKPEFLGDTFDLHVYEEFKSFRNLNYLLQRIKPYNPKGRVQNEEEAKDFDFKIRECLNKYGISYGKVPGSREGGQLIVKDVLELLE